MLVLCLKFCDAKNSKYAYFQLFQINKVQIFIQGPAGKWLNGLL